MKFDNLSSSKRINEWINESYRECKASYPIPKKGRIAFDIGANVGGFCIHAHKNFDKIFAFEPVVENYNILCQVLEQMNIKNVEVYNMAIYSESGLQLPMKVCGRNDKNNKLISGDVTCIDTPVVNFKNIDQVCETISLKDVIDALEINYLDYLKLDCEGSEYEILENYDDYNKIMLICMEIHQFYGIERKINLLKMLYENYYFADIDDGDKEYKDVSEVIRKSKENSFMKYKNLHNVLLINRNLKQ